MRKIVLIFRSLLAVLIVAAVGYFVVQSLRGWRNRSFYAAREVQRATNGGTTYYVGGAGDDRAAGTAPGTAWRSVARANDHTFAPGDRLLFEGGRTFRGGLRLDHEDAGTPAHPITVGSYGEGRATIDAGDGDGVSARNTMGVRVSDINFVGSGTGTNTGSGILLVNDLVGDVKLPFVRVERVEARGFGECGVMIDGNNGASGFRDVRITDVSAHDNATAGVYVYGEFTQLKSFAAHFLPPAYAHEDVYVGDVRAFDNQGKRGRKRLNTGSGIVLSDVNRGVIERSVAYNNGWLCESYQGGPVGVWAWDSNEIIIQHNESYANRTGTFTDGGGFDLDGGVTNSVMQYNYSHDNDGAGYLLAQFPLARPFRNNTVRYNISIDDARKNNRGAISLWGDVTSTDVYNNTVIVSPAGHGTPRAVFLESSEDAFFFENRATSGVSLRNNIFQTTNGLPLIYMTGGHRDLRFQGNNYFSIGGEFKIIWGEAVFSDLGAWQQATQQELVEGRNVAARHDPGFEIAADDDDEAKGDAIMRARLPRSSPLVDAGLDLARLFGTGTGTRDFFGARLPQGTGFDVGAHELAIDELAAREPER